MIPRGLTRILTRRLKNKPEKGGDEVKNYPLYEVDLYEDFKTFVDSLEGNHGNNTAITSFNQDGEKISYSYSRLAGDTLAFAEILTEKKIAGKHVAVVSQNSYMFVVSLLAVT